MPSFLSFELYFSLAESEESEIGVGGEFAGEIDDREEEEIAAVQQVRIAQTQCSFHPTRPAMHFFTLP